ncbi:MAG: CoA-binding protein [Deltaproteobacteria bacterium]|nr:CoA-binding protein [Deltaproteobacteria bacterium]
MENRKYFDAIFHPRTLAVVGAPQERPLGWPGIFGCIRDYGYPGRLYPINPRVTHVEGVRSYPDLVSVPEPIDLVIISVPAPAVPAALMDCVASGNRNVHIFTSGFNETGEEKGVELHRQILEIAHAGGLRVIGPNCMGVYVPKERLTTWVNPSRKDGPVAFVSQSGGHAQDFTGFASRLGIHFSKVVSYGNALTLDSTDFLEYLAGDPDTQIITMYLEGVKDGRRLLEVVSRINRTKPVIILKAGLTEAGTRAVASHTGSMAGGEHIWDAFFKMSGAVRVFSLEDMAHLTLAFRHLDTTGGNRIAVIGHGGGIAVSAADACSSAGLTIPPFSAETQEELRSFIPSSGNMIRNPVDAIPIFIDTANIQQMLDLASSELDIDMLMVSLSLDWIYDVDGGVHINRIAEYLAGHAREFVNGKPLVVTWRTYRNDPRIFDAGLRIERLLLESGIPVYRGFESATGALARWARYHRFIRERIPV